MNSIIKHFEFKSSEGMDVSIDAARFKGKPVFLAVPLARALGYTNPADALKKHCKSLIKLNYSESRELGFGDNPRAFNLLVRRMCFASSCAAHSLQQNVSVIGYVKRCSRR